MTGSVGVTSIGMTEAANLTSRVIVIRNPILYQHSHRPVIWFCALVVSTRAAAIYQTDFGLIRRLRCEGPEDALCHGGATNIAETDE